MVRRLALAWLCVAGVSVPTWADDFDPPPWLRSPPGWHTGQQRAATFHWEFHDAPLGGGIVDMNGPLTSVGDDPGAVPAIIGEMRGSDVYWDQDLEAWFFPFGGEIWLAVGNAVDAPEYAEYKDFWIQITFDINYMVTPELPGVTGVTGYLDSGGQVFGQAVDPAVFSLVGERLLGLREHWRTTPESDWEEITISVSAETTVYQVVVDTVSMPEPGTAALLIFGGLGVLLRRNRSRS